MNENESVTMNKATIEKILSMFPDDAEVVAEYTLVDKYNTTYSCYIEGINLNVNSDNTLSAILRLYEKRDAA